MWLVCRRATGKQARAGRESALIFARALSLLAHDLGEEEFQVKYPMVHHEMRCLIEKI